MPTLSLVLITFGIHTKKGISWLLVCCFVRLCYDDSFNFVYFIFYLRLDAQKQQARISSRLDYICTVATATGCVLPPVATPIVTAYTKQTSPSWNRVI